MKYRLSVNDLAIAHGGVRLRQMGLLVIDTSNDAGDQRSRHLFLPDALQPFLGRCSRTGDFGVVADRIFMDVGIDRLRRLAIASIENGCRGRNRNPLVTRLQTSRQYLQSLRAFGAVGWTGTRTATGVSGAL